MIVFTNYDLFTMNLYDGNGRKTPKYVQTKKGKIPLLVALPPTPRLRKWRPTVFRCPKTPKTSRTYPMWDWDPTLVG